MRPSGWVLLAVDIGIKVAWFVPPRSEAGE